MGSLENSFDSTVNESRLLKPVDEAIVETGRKIASQIDYAVEHGEGQEITKALYLAPHLVNILRELLATPASRRAAGLEEESVGGKLAELRAARRSA